MKLHILCPETLVVLILLLDRWKLADCYDPLDPNGNITVTIDIHNWIDDQTYLARVTIQNYYQYRNIEKPGWRLGWTWAAKEIILSMAGAVATKQGNCSEFKSLQNVPHSCKKYPVIADQNPDAAGENWTANCCRDGILSAWAIDPKNSISSFTMYIGNLNGKNSASPPINLTLLTPGLGYTCGQLEDVPPTTFKVEMGNREEQVLRTWKSACTYSPFVENNTPACCVSLSTFYNSKITPCPACSCRCRNKTCDGAREIKLLTNNDDENSDSVAIVGCTYHMCPVQVHWHVKANYRDKWRVKMTISNFRYSYNYTDWNLVVQHPGLDQPIQSYSFNYSRLTTVGGMDEAAIFWGLEYYNSELPQASNEKQSFVTSDIIIDKDYDSFTLNNGWPLPRRVYFNGDDCEMSDNYPGLPNSTNFTTPNALYLLFFLPLLIFLFL